MDHGSRLHALLSASNSNRWLNCTKSARLEETIPDSQSVYAAEGELAHELADNSLKYLTGVISSEKYLETKKDLMSNSLFFEDMIDDVAIYVDLVAERFTQYQDLNGTAVLSIEQKLDYSDYVPDGFGTGDAVIISNGVLEVIDLKYGMGVPVYADKNTQLKLYALGAIKNLNYDGLLYSIHDVKLTIVQPRLNNISSWAVPYDELIEWAEGFVKPTAVVAYNGSGSYETGSWCKWCKAKAVCTAYHEKVIEIAKYDFADPDSLTLDELSLIYSQANEIKSWLDAVGDYLFEKAKQGESIPGFKLVESRKNRKWKDDDLVASRLTGLGLKQDEIYNQKLKSITAIKNLMSVDDFNEHVANLIYKPAGGPTLAPVDDKRPIYGVGQAKIDFET